MGDPRLLQHHMRCRAAAATQHATPIGDTVFVVMRAGAVVCMGVQGPMLAQDSMIRRGNTCRLKVGRDLRDRNADRDGAGARQGRARACETGQRQQQHNSN